MFWRLGLYFLEVFFVVIGILGLSYFLGERHQERNTNLPYEGGVTSYGSARLKFSVKFYQVALLFVIFDLEAVFLFAWAAALRETGWAGFATASVFVGILAISLAYLIRKGALDWSR